MLLRGVMVVILRKNVNWMKYLSQERKVTYLKVQSSDQGKKVWLKKHGIQICLVAPWIRICLPVHGPWVRSLVWEDPTGSGTTKPMGRRYWARALKPKYWAHVLQLLKSVFLEPILCNERSHCSEKLCTATPLATTRESPQSNEDPQQPKINK